MFLPICKQDMKKRGWDECDIILITGDAYVDHHSYGVAVIARVLENEGYKVGIIAQPNWKFIDDFKKLGRPKLFFGITSGNVDSMVANYTANNRKRKQDVNSPMNEAGRRPDRSLIVYSNKVREAFKNVPIVLGGLEASMRRLAHYDYFSNSVRRSVLMDTKADMIVYGMGEKQIIEIASRMNKGETIKDINNIKGTVVLSSDYNFLDEYVKIPSYEEIKNNHDKFNKAYRLFYDELSVRDGKTIVQAHSDRYIIQLPPALPLKEEEIDKVYELPYMRNYHSIYQKTGGIKGFETVVNSVVSHRGCSGECNFCGLGLHQGRIIQSRSAKSIVKEVKYITSKQSFHGTITDVGGPTANLYKAKCSLWKEDKICKRKNCLVPQKCENLELGYKQATSLYSTLRKLDKVKHVFINSGIRYDLLVEPYADSYFEKLCKDHISGQMKVAPEHVSSNVLKLMNKPDFSVYEKFVKKFRKISKRLNKNLFLVNYFITSHPGSKKEDASLLAKYCRSLKINPEQIQDYTPLPMTISSCMYYTGKHPFTNEKIYIPKSYKERKVQRNLLQKTKNIRGRR